MSRKPTPGPAKASVQLMYVGPTLLRPVFLSHRCVYAGGIPQFAQALTAKDTELAGCFIPLAEAGKALRELEGYPGATSGEHVRRFTSVRKRYLDGGPAQKQKSEDRGTGQVPPERRESDVKPAGEAKL